MAAHQEVTDSYELLSLRAENRKDAFALSLHRRSCIDESVKTILALLLR